jgi:hypothetical protein
MIMSKRSVSMYRKLIAGGLAAVMAASMAAVPAQAKKGGKHGHHHFRIYEIVGPVCVEWGWVRTRDGRKWRCIDWD